MFFTGCSFLAKIRSSFAEGVSLKAVATGPWLQVDGSVSLHLLTGIFSLLSRENITPRGSK
jgi:hypothetical protein